MEDKKEDKNFVIKAVAKNDSTGQYMTIYENGALEIDGTEFDGLAIHNVVVMNDDHLEPVTPHDLREYSFIYSDKDFTTKEEFQRTYKLDPEEVWFSRESLENWREYRNTGVEKKPTSEILTDIIEESILEENYEAPEEEKVYPFAVVEFIVVDSHGNHQYTIHEGLSWEVIRRA